MSSEDVSIKRVAETVCRAVGDTEIVHTPGRSGDFGGVEVDGSRAQRELGWTASTSFDEGVRRYVESVRASEGRRVAIRRPLGERLETVRRVLSPLALLGVIVACLAAAGSVDEVLSEAPLAVITMTVALPVALVWSLDWGVVARRRLGLGFWSLSGLLLLLLVAPLPGSDELTGHPVVLVLLAVSAAIAAGLATGKPLPAWRERLSD